MTKWITSIVVLCLYKSNESPNFSHSILIDSEITRVANCHKIIKQMAK